VIQLPFFKYTGHHFVVIAKTPSQWRPSSKDFDASDTERFAADRFIRPASRGLAQLVSSNQEQSTNSVLPHFYHGLPAELKRMMVEEQEKSNKEFMDSIAYKKLFKNNEANFMKKYLKRRREYIAAAQRIQYLYRQNKQFKTLKLLVRYHRGASTIQRVFRGHRGRIYFKKYLRVMTCASLIVQSVFRSFASRQRTKALRKKMNDAAINIQRVYRGLMKRKYVHWMRQNEKCVVQIQRVARGFVSRSRATRIKKANYKRHILIPACKNIQRIWRGFLDRKNAKKRRQDLQIHNVVIPAIIRVQCIVRGLIARRLRNQYRKAWFAAIKIQRAWKKYRYYKKWKLLLDLRLRQKMASKIGAMTRGYITRKFYHHERRKQYFRRIVQPSAVKIQRIYRGYITRKKLQVYRDKTEAVITIQQMWRRRKELSIVIERLRSFRESIRQSRAATIQRAYRCYLARCTLLYLRMNQIARHGKATLVIQSAWRSYCTRIQINEFRLFSIVEKKARAMTEWKDKREAIEFDMEDAKADLKRVVKYKTKSLRRIKELKDMRIEWERRQPVIEKELANLTAEDIDRGWNEAFETEKSIIHFSLQLSVEDILSRKQQVREYDNEIEDLKLEIDDLERDLEECMMEEMIEIESYRDFEMHRANKLFADEKERRVRLQRIRWRVKNVRNNVILHERKDIQKIENDFLAKRQPQEYGILSFQKKKFMQNKLEEAIRSAALQNAAQRKEEIDRLSIQNVKAHATFDEAIQKVRKVAQEGTFDFRVPKSDIREDRTKMCWNCGRIHCDCNVKNVSAVVVNNISKTKKKSVHKRRQYDDD
jgi:abnormal spindle-like microcephaly-associated protein